jgi:cell wall-associated NlpC family hydrolase
VGVRVRVRQDVFKGVNADQQKNMMHKDSSPHIGDLVFYGKSFTTYATHVGVYVGNVTMIDAHQTGTYIENDSVSQPTLHLIGYCNM